MNQTASEILIEVCFMFKLSVQQILGKSKRAPKVKARHHLMWRLRKELKMSYGTIGKFCKRDHSTVVYAVQKIEAKLKDETIKNG